MMNKEGKVAEGGSASVQAAAANADWSSVPGFGLILANQLGAASWPMTAATFILVPKQPNDPAAATEALKFFAWAYANGGKMAAELDYVPMPKKVIDVVQKLWASEIKDSSGKPLYTAMKVWRNFSRARCRCFRVVALCSPACRTASCAAAGISFEWALPPPCFGVCGAGRAVEERRDEPGPEAIRG